MVGNRMGNSRETFLPLDMITNILKKLPVKTLSRFKCVAKNWVKLIESPNFIAQHLTHSTSNNPVLLYQQSPSSFHLIGPDSRVHGPQSMDFDGQVIGSSNGLLCVGDNDSNDLFLLNPAVRQVKKVPETLIDICDCYSIGFGFSHVANNYKLVRISHRDQDREEHFVNYYNDRINRAEVYSLTIGSWKEVNVVHLQNLHITSTSVTVNGAIFWEANIISESGPENDPKFILSFDIAQEVFALLKAPPPPQSQSQSTPAPSYREVLTAHNDKLAMFHQFTMENYQYCCVDLWVLEDICAARENWIRKYSVRRFPIFLNPTCFWRDHIVCWRAFNSHNNPIDRVENLALINPYKGELKNLPIIRHYDYYGVFNYAESLIPISDIHHDQ